MYRDLYNREIGEDILNLLKKYGIETIEKARTVCPIYLHSFDYGTVKYWGGHTELPNNYLVANGQSFDLVDTAKYATGIGFESEFLWDYKKNAPTDTFYKARELGLILHIWTFKDDVGLLNSKSNIVSIGLCRKCIVLRIRC
jgi:glycerophosphoryl diester phosphodiesterase